MQKDDYFQNVALSLIASGAIGNAIDRIHKQSVTDFYVSIPKVQLGSLGYKIISAWPSGQVLILRTRYCCRYHYVCLLWFLCTR